MYLLDTTTSITRGTEYLRYPNRRYHVYLVPADIALHDSVVSATDWCVDISAQGKGNCAEEVNAEDENDDVNMEVEMVKD